MKRTLLAFSLPLPLPLPLAFALALALALTLACGCGDSSPSDGDAGAPDGEVDYPENPYDAVDIFVGTGGDGFGVGSALPGATMPYGMVKLSPDTSSVNGAQMQWSHCGGYAYDDPKIVGFSHTHMHGIGVPGYGSVLFVPTVGFDDTTLWDNEGRQSYAKETEEAAPGYYAVTLGDTDIRVELTAGARTGYHRWTWPADTAAGDALLTVDLSYAIGGGSGLAGAVEILPTERRMRGWTHTDSDHGGDFRVYFDAVFDADFSGYGTWADGVVSDGVATAEASAVGAWLVFDLSGGSTVEAEVGISYTGPNGAQGNREDDAVGSFDAAHTRAADAWAAQLSVIDVEGGTAKEQRIFYSALYHVYQHPTLFTDHDGSYHGFDHVIQNDGRPFYTDFSLWDTYRTLHPLLILLAPTESADMAQSLVRMAEQWGGLPRWPLATSDSGSMIGTSADVVLAGSYLKGVTDFDVQTAWQYMWAHAQGPVCCAGRAGIEQYLTLGYVATDVTGGAVSRTQEYGWDDWALANLATALGYDTEAATLLAQVQNIANLWDPDTEFFRGRNADGSWDEHFEPTRWEEYYTEGDAWQHLWLTPDMELLSSIMGGRTAMLDRLEEFFELSRYDWEHSDLGYWAPLPYYWHGNEPDLHAAYIFAAGGRPHKAQEWVRWIMDIHYDLGPQGLSGNDDAGTLSAWYVWSALGFYPWAGSDLYYVGTPAFDRAVVHLPGGDLVVEATGRDQGYYVQSVELNGVPLEEPWFTHSDIVNGGTLSFTLGAEPSSWGSAE
ncbi:MAG: GH92 family glycosyl hydrolase [bacterium]